MHVTIIKSDKRAREKPCLRCGYSLRKIESNHCPECGLSTWMSLNNNDALEWSRPEWLRRMSLGLGVMSGAQLLGLAPYVILIWVMISAATGKPVQGFFAWVSVAKLCAAVSLLVYHGGMLMLTWSERRYPDRLKSWRIASWVVAGIAAVFALLLMVWALSLAGYGLLYTAMNVVVLAGIFVALGYLRRLARRIPNSTLARVCGILMFVPVVPFLKVFPFFGVYLIMRSLWIAEFLPLIFLPVTAVLFVWFAVQFRRAAASAEKSWEAETLVSR